MARHPCPSECQEASDAFIELRLACEQVEILALTALTKARIAVNSMLEKEPTMLVMSSGPLEEKLYLLAKVGAQARSMHLAGSKLMRSNGFSLPNPPPYTHDTRPENAEVFQKLHHRR